MGDGAEYSCGQHNTHNVWGGTRTLCAFRLIPHLRANRGNMYKITMIKRATDWAVELKTASGGIFGFGDDPISALAALLRTHSRKCAAALLETTGHYDHMRQLLAQAVDLLDSLDVNNSVPALRAAEIEPLVRAIRQELDDAA